MKMVLKAWRRARGFSTQAMADALSVTQKTYINWEAAPKKISIGNAFRIAEILNVEVDDIIFLPDDSKKNGISKENSSRT